MSRHGRTRALLFAVLVVSLVVGYERTRAAAPQAAQAVQADAFEGTLSVVWADPRPGQPGPGETLFSLDLPDGRQLALDLTGREHEALRHFGRQVRVRGRMATRPATTPRGAAQQGIVVDTIEAAPRGAAAMPAASEPEAAVLGGRRVLFLLVKFADDTNVPHAPAFFTDLTNPDTPTVAGIPATLNGFFKKTSGNQFSWIGDVGGAGGIGAPQGWITLPGSKATYANCGFGSTCANINLLTTDAVNAAHAQGISFAAYDNLNIVLSNDLDCCAYGGGRTIDGKFMGVTWEPPWGQETRVYAHEMGHSLGLPHSGWVYFAYDSPWDVMSDYSDLVVLNCGSYFSRNDNTTRNLGCREPGNGYISPYKDVLGWIPAGNQVTTNTTSNTTVTIEGASLTLGSGVKMVKVCLPGFSCTGTGSSTRYFTIEARVKNGGATTLYDNGIPNEGVIIHDVYFGRGPIGGGLPCFFNSQSGWAVPVDATPGDYSASSCSGTGLRNAQFGVGGVYTNSTYGFRVSVVNRVGNNFVVNVQSLINTEIALDAPGTGSTVAKPFTVRGWAINRSAATGAGVDAVHVYATPAGGSAVFLGAATHGSARGDVGAAFGAQFTNSGWVLNNAGASLAPGSYTITAYARNAATGVFDGSASRTSVTVTGPVSTPSLYLDAPTDNSIVTSAFEVVGWAIDAGAATGTGVDAVQFYVQPNGSPAPGVFVGNGTYGTPRNDVGAILGTRYTNSGFHFTITGLGPGSYTLGVYARSTVTGSFSIVKTVPFSINANQLMSIDLPSPESTVSAPSFTVAGWAIDRLAAAGTGVDTLHVYAYRNPGSGEAAIFLGVATVGFARSDVAGLYGARYTNSGYSLDVNRAASGLTPGVYNIVVHAHSTAAGAFNNVAAVRVTIQ